MAIADALCENSTLATLDLGSNSMWLPQTTAPVYCDSRTNNAIGDAGAKAVADALSENSALVKLSLRCNHIGPAGALAIGAALRQHKNG